LEGMNEQLRVQLRVERDALVSRYSAELDELRSELARLQRERDDWLLLTENEKRRVGHQTHCQHL